MRTVIALMLCVLSTPLPAQTILRTFTSPDGAFQFKYSNLLVRCMEQDHDEGEHAPWFPSDSCDGYVPPCDAFRGPGNHTVACIAYPKAKFADYPTFDTATFAVAEIKGPDSEKKCLSGSPSGANDLHDVTIHGAKFRAFEDDSLAASDHVRTHFYLGFHANRCYQLSIQVVTTSSGAFDPPVKELSDKDWAEVNGLLKNCLISFRFLK